MVEKLINKVYLDVINDILVGINEEDKEEIKNGYFKYLYNLYADKDINETNYNNMLVAITEIEKNKWQSRSVEDRLYYFKKDNSFEIITSLSKKAYELASLRRATDSPIVIKKKEADEYINRLTSELAGVLEFNKEEAKRLVSESVVDFIYASGGDEDTTSFRIGHLKK